jgi:hypothetical protein
VHLDPDTVSTGLHHRVERRAGVKDALATSSLTRSVRRVGEVAKAGDVEDLLDERRAWPALTGADAKAWWLSLMPAAPGR